MVIIFYGKCGLCVQVIVRCKCVIVSWKCATVGFGRLQINMADVVCCQRIPKYKCFIII